MTAKAWLIVAVVVLLLGECCAILWLWRDKDNAQAALIAAQTVHVADVKTHTDDQATITRITNYNAANQRVLAQFVAKAAQIDAAFSVLNANISNLRRSNADVEKYLSQPIPLPLLCLLDPANSLCAVPGKAGAAPAAAGH